MDAIDTTYQNIPVVLEDDRPIKDDFAYKEEAPVEKVEFNFSFEELISSLLERKDVELASEGDVKLVAEDLPMVVENVLEEENGSLLLKSFSGNKNSKERILKVETSEKPIIEDEIEERTFIEYELDVSGKIESTIENDKKTEIEEIIKKENISIDNIKNEEDDKKNEISFGFSSYAMQKKNVKIEKSDIKKEDKVKEIESSNVLEDLPLTKHKEKLAKKLPIEVEDLRSMKESFEVKDRVEENFSSGDFSSGSRASNQKYMEGSTSSVAKNENVEGAKESGFSSILAEQLRAEATSIVERGKIVLRDGNVGEIRLQLKPEHLGTLRIQIKLSGDKKLEGEVSVSSKEAYDAFEDAKNELIMAFKDAGFENSSFNLEWKGDQNAKDVREFDLDKYFSAEKTHLSLSEKLNLTENEVYKAGQAKNLNILA